MAERANSSDSPRSAGLVAGALAFALFLATTHPQPLSHDAAEFQALAATGGIAHAGYPLLVMLLQLFGRLPFSTMAFRANLLSCVSGAVAIGLAAAAARRLTRRPLAAFAGAAALALSMTMWSESTRAGVHAFTLAIDAAIFLLALRFVERGGGWNAFAIGLLLGFGLVSHLTVLSLIPPLAGALALAARAHRLRPVHVGAAALGLTLGLTPLAYLVAHDRPDQPMNYIESTLDLGSGQYLPGGMPPLSHPQRVAWLLSARQYLAHTTFRPFEDPTFRLRIVTLDLALNEFPIWGCLLALCGGWMVWRRRDRHALMLGLWLSGTVFWLLLGAARGMVAIFFLPGAWVISQLIACGVDAVGNKSWLREATLMILLVVAPFVRLSTRDVPRALAGRPTIELVWTQLGARSWSPFRGDDSWEAFGRGVMRVLPPRAVVLSCWEEGMTLSYFRHAVELRRDIDIRLTCWNAGRVRREIDNAEGQRRIVYTTFDPALAQMPGLRFDPPNVWDRGRLWHVSLRDSADFNAPN